MKTSNIFQKLKATGAYNTDGMKPQLPGLGSPLDKKLIDAQKNLPQELKDKIEAAPETSPANYGTAPGPLKNNPKYGKLIKQVDLGGGKTKSYYEVPGSNMPRISTTQKTVKEQKKPSPTPKKGCSPTKLVPEEVDSNPRRAARIARRRARRGHRAAIRYSNACGRNTRGKGSTFKN